MRLSVMRENIFGYDMSVRKSLAFVIMHISIKYIGLFKQKIHTLSPLHLVSPLSLITLSPLRLVHTLSLPPLSPLPIDLSSETKMKGKHHVYFRTYTQNYPGQYQ